MHALWSCQQTQADNSLRRRFSWCLIPRSWFWMICLLSTIQQPHRSHHFILLLRHACVHAGEQLLASARFHLCVHASACILPSAHCGSMHYISLLSFSVKNEPEARLNRPNGRGMEKDWQQKPGWDPQSFRVGILLLDDKQMDNFRWGAVLCQLSFLIPSLDTLRCNAV